MSLTLTDLNLIMYGIFRSQFWQRGVNIKYLIS